MIYFIFSACAGEWTDCVSEDEEYLQSKTTFYKDCTLVSVGDNDVLNDASDNSCSGPTRCENGRIGDPNDQSFIGQDPFGNCTCPTQTNDVAESIIPEKLSQIPISRYKRQTNERYKSAGGRRCRLLRTRKGTRKKVCDEIVLLRTMFYDDALVIARIEDKNCEDFKDDPATCSILGFDCDDSSGCF